MLSFKIVKMAKILLAKKCARKIVNCYRMFAELQEALAGGRALNKSERLIASSAPGHKHRPSTASASSSIRVQG